MSSPIQALIFDFDGLIIDTELPELQSWQEVYQAHGCLLPHAEWMQSIGTAAVFDPYETLSVQLGKPVGKDSVRRMRRTRFAQLMAHQNLLPGVRNVIDEAVRRQLKLAVASSSAHSWVDGYLDKFELRTHFTCVKCADDVERVKPDPALYLEAVRGLGVEPHAVVAFEDSLNGLRAAKAAGLFCVVVPNPVTKGMAFDGADLLLDSLADMSLAEILQHAERGCCEY